MPLIVFGGNSSEGYLVTFVSFSDFAPKFLDLVELVRSLVFFGGLF